MSRSSLAPVLLSLLIAACSATQPAPPSSPPVPSPAAASSTPGALKGAPTATSAPPLETLSPGASASLDVSAAYANLPGWIVFEHFGQKPDGTTPTFDFDLRMIWLVHPDGSGLHELAPGKPLDGKVSPDISRDGSRVTFSSWGPLVRVWQTLIEGGTPVLVSSTCSGRSDDCQASDPAWSPDGKRVAFAHLDAKRGASTIAVQDLRTGSIRDLTMTSIELSKGRVAQPSWSPGGTAIAYHRDLQGPTDEHITDARLFVVRADNSSIKELPQPAGRWAADADWSPDGSRILFSSAPNRETEGWADGPPAGIYTVSPDGSGLQEICAPCLDSGWAPSWTPDGRRILFWGNRTFAMMDADGGNMAHINAPRLTWFANGRGFGYAGFLAPSR